MKYLGAHISSAQQFKLVEILGQKTGITAMQTYVSNPVRWAVKPIDTTIAEILIKRVKKTQIKNIFLHSIYLINLANTTNKQNYHLSKLSLVSYLNFMHDFNEIAAKYNIKARIKGVVLHPGSAKQDTDTETAINNVNQALEWVLNKTPDDTIILIENTAGSGNLIGDTFDELLALRNSVKERDRVKYCIDTQHSFASGYNWKDSVDQIIDLLDTTIGLENVELFHVNDSRPEYNSHKDRHANLGEGNIELPAFKQLLNHPKLDNKSFILETPALGNPTTAIKEIQTLLNMIKE